MKTVCINCPVGCNLDIEVNGDLITVKGNACLRGVTYGKEEVTAPKRVVTSLIKSEKFIYSVKTTKPILKDKIFSVLEDISKIKIEGNLKIGDLVCENILDTGADLVVTGIN